MDWVEDVIRKPRWYKRLWMAWKLRGAKQVIAGPVIISNDWRITPGAIEQMEARLEAMREDLEQ